VIPPYPFKFASKKRSNEARNLMGGFHHNGKMFIPSEKPRRLKDAVK